MQHHASRCDARHRPLSRERARQLSSDDRLYLEDFSVGQRFVSGTAMLDAASITAFAAQFDPQPFHLEEAEAAQSFFGGLAASGWHTAAVTMRLLVESLPVAGGLIGAGGEVAWPRPTRPGDTLQVTSIVEEVTPSRSRPERGMIRVRSETRNQCGEVAQVLTSRMVVQRRGMDRAGGAPPSPLAGEGGSRGARVGGEG